MLTLSSVRNELGIGTTEHSFDDELKRMIRQVTARIRQRTSRHICWQVDDLKQVGATLQIRCVGHQLKNGEVVKIVGSNSTPTLGNARVCAVQPMRKGLLISMSQLE